MTEKARKKKAECESGSAKKEQKDSCAERNKKGGGGCKKIKINKE